MRKICLMIILGSLSITSAFAGTDDSEPRPQSGAYIDAGLGVVYGSVRLFGMRYTEAGTFGLNTALGYQLNPYFAAEAGYVGYDFSGEILHSLDVAGKFILPITEGPHAFSLFLKAGPALLFENSGESQIQLFTGIGAAYKLNEKLDLTAQIQGSSNGFVDFGLMSIGLSYHF